MCRRYCTGYLSVECRLSLLLFFVPLVLLSPRGSAGGFCEFFHNATLSSLLLPLQHVIVLRFTFPQCVWVCVCLPLSTYICTSLCVCVCMFSFYLCYNFPYAFSILCAASLFLPVAVCYNFPLFCSILIWFHKVLLFVFQAFILACLYSLHRGSIMNLSCNICKP